MLHFARFGAKFARKQCNLLCAGRQEGDKKERLPALPFLGKISLNSRLCAERWLLSAALGWSVLARAGDGIVQIERFALRVLWRYGHKYPPAVAVRELALKVFRQHVRKQAQEKEGDGNARHNHRKHVGGVHGGEHEPERKSRAEQLHRVFRNLDKPVHARLFRALQIDAVAHRGHDDGERQSDCD